MQQNRRSSTASIDEDGICRVDPTTPGGRKMQLFQLAGLPLLPIIALFIYMLVNLTLEVERLKNMHSLYDLISEIEDMVNNVVSQLLDEAAAAVAYVGTNGTELLGALTPIYVKTDEALEAYRWPADGIAHYTTKKHFQASLARHRAEVNLGRPYVLEEINYYETVLNYIGDWKSSVFEETSMRTEVWMSVTSYISLMKASTSLSFERMLGTLYFVYGYLSPELHSIYVSYHESSAVQVENADLLYANFKDHYAKGTQRRQVIETSYRQMAATIYENLPSEMNPYRGISWDRRISSHVQTLSRVRRLLLADTYTMLDEDITSSIRTLSYYVIILIVLMGAFLPYLLYNSARTTDSLRAYTTMMYHNNQELRREKRKAEKLLNQMLPRSVAEKLRRGHDVMAESFESVTVYFSDIPDFPEISRSSSPMEIVTFLNEVYRFMDNHIERYDVYKVETIGCVYMVVSGLPSRNGDRHTTEIARMSLDVLEDMEDFIIPHMKDRSVKLRIGLSSASKIHITQRTADMLKKKGGYKVEPRGKIEIKGKGSMDTFWLIGRSSDASKPVKRGSNGTGLDS